MSINRKFTRRDFFEIRGMTAFGLIAAGQTSSQSKKIETHFVPFEAAIKEANLFSIMPAYHEIDGVPVHANKSLKCICAMRSAPSHGR